MIFNLVGNALKFTFKGGITIVVDFDGEYLTTQCIDTGIGIKEKDLKLLF